MARPEGEETRGEAAGELGEADAAHLRRAIALAWRARETGNLPFGAVLVDGDGNVVLEGHNESLLPVRDATNHVETAVVKQAARRFSPEQMASFTLYASTEPCAMCAGTAYWAGVGRVVFGVTEHGLKDITGYHPDNPTMDLPSRVVFAHGQRPVEVIGPVLLDEAIRVHQGFWERGE